MDSIISVVLCFIAGVILGWYMREWAAVRTVNRLLSKADDLDTEATGDILNVYVTQIQDQFYVYDSTTHMFIVQVKTKEEMFKYFEEKFPSKTVVMKKAHLDLFDVA